MDNEKQQQISEIKKLIADGEIEKALERLLSFLERDSAYLNMHSDALQAMSQYKTTRREEAKGTISHEEARRSYSKITDLTLNLLEELQQEDRLKPYQRRRWTLIAGIALALLLAAGGAFWYFNQNETPGPEEDWSCQGFSENDFSILCLPFQGSDTIDYVTPQNIREFFITFENNHRIPLDYQIIPLGSHITSDINRFPPDFEFASEVGQDCGAQLVLWGRSGRRDQENKVVQTRYKFILTENGGFQMKKVTMNNTDGTVLDTVRFISNFATEGEIREQLSTVTQLILGIIAHEKDQPQLAIAQLQGIESRDSVTTLARDMFLADSYLSTGQTAEANAALDRVTEEHPEYWLGWHNRGLLYLQKGYESQGEARENYLDKAIDDLNRRLMMKDDDPESLLARGQAYLTTEQLQKARQDFEKADSVQPQSPLIRSKLETVRREIDVQQNIRQDALDRLEQNADDREARRELIQADLKLGNIREALNQSEILLESNPDQNTFRGLIELFDRQRSLPEAQPVLEKAIQKGLINNQERTQIIERRLRPQFKIDSSLKSRQQ